MSDRQYEFITDPIIMTSSRLEAIANHFVFEPMGLTSASAKIIKLLVISKKGELTPTQIVEKTGGTKSNISQRLNFLERLGLIERVVRKSICGCDRRQVPVRVTGTGRKKCQEACKRLKGPIFILEKHFTKQELEANIAFFKKMNRVLDKCEEELPKIFESQKGDFRSNLK